ncbi:ABC transporter ATP-binding protein, partial [Streptococcus pyogenes]
VSETHWAKTWLLHPEAPKVQKPEVIQDLHQKILRKMSQQEEGNV